MPKNSVKNPSPNHPSCIRTAIQEADMEAFPLHLLHLGLSVQTYRIILIHSRK